MQATADYWVNNTGTFFVVQKHILSETQRISPLNFGNVFYDLIDRNLLLHLKVKICEIWSSIP